MPWGKQYGVSKADTTGKHSSIAKITRPVLAGILPRQRLFEHLKESRDKPITRWKRNIEEIDGALDKLLSLRGVYFDWDEEHGG